MSERSHDLSERRGMKWLPFQGMTQFGFFHHLT